MCYQGQGISNLGTCILLLSRVWDMQLIADRTTIKSFLFDDADIDQGFWQFFLVPVIPVNSPPIAPANPCVKFWILAKKRILRTSDADFWQIHESSVYLEPVGLHFKYSWILIWTECSLWKVKPILHFQTFLSNKYHYRPEWSGYKINQWSHHVWADKIEVDLEENWC